MCVADSQASAVPMYFPGVSAKGPSSQGFLVCPSYCVPEEAKKK